MPENSTQTTQPAWRRYLAYATMAVMPIAGNIEKLIKQEKVQPVYAGALDILLPVLLLCLLIDLLSHRERVRFKIPPVPLILWVLLAAASYFWIEREPGSELLKPTLKVIGTGAFYVLAGVWVFQNIADTATEYRKLALILGASGSICLLLAVKQYFGPAGIPFDPDNPLQDLKGTTNIRLAGWYDFRAVFGSQMALLAPAAAAFALSDRSVAVRWAAAVFVVLALCVTMAGGGFIAACTGVVIVACAFGVSGRWMTALLALALVMGIVGIVLPRLPRHNPDVLLRNVALYAVVDTDKGEVRKPTPRLRRYQAAIDLFGAPANRDDAASPSLWTRGVGIGRYQGQLNRFYQPEYPKPGRATDDEAAFDLDADERFTFGFLETSAVELGVPGLLVLLMLFGTWIAAAQGAFARRESIVPSDSATLALAALGAGVGALVVSVFASPMIPGVKGTAAFFMALALVTHAWSRQTHD